MCFKKKDGISKTLILTRWNSQLFKYGMNLKFEFCKNHYEVLLLCFFFFFFLQYIFGICKAFGRANTSK